MASRFSLGSTIDVEESRQSINDPVSPVEARLAAIVDSSDDAIISKDLNGIITSWNAAATRIFGYSAEEIVGKSVLILIPPELHSEEPEILRKVGSGERIEHFETRRIGKHGQILDISLTISPIKDASGAIIGISKIARDITGRKRTEAALIESERLAVIGRMAATIAHEVNNPLEAILNLGFLLSNHPSLDDEAREYTRILLDEVVRVGEITKQTLSFYRDSSDPSKVEVEDVMDGVLKLHRTLIEQKSVQVFKHYRATASMWARAGELRQVFTNLIVNSIDALPIGGSLVVRVSPKRNQDMVCVVVADNGPGIPEDIRERIFQPFFSTKQDKGTGLGLWVSQSIIRKYGGSIRMRTRSGPGQPTGTMFRVCVPCKAALP